MIKQEKGNKPLKFGNVEKSLALNWQVLAVSVSVAICTWVGSEVVPALAEYGGTLASLSGLLAMVLPGVLAFLRNNQDLTLDRRI